MGTDARVVEALESRAKWRTNEFTSIEPHRHGERYIRVIQLKKKKNSDASVYKSYLFTSVAKKVPTFTKPTAEYDRSQKESSMNSSES